MAEYSLLFKKATTITAKNDLTVEIAPTQREGTFTGTNYSCFNTENIKCSNIYLERQLLATEFIDFARLNVNTDELSKAQTRDI